MHVAAVTTETGSNTSSAPCDSTLCPPSATSATLFDNHNLSPEVILTTSSQATPTAFCLTSNNIGNGAIASNFPGLKLKIEATKIPDHKFNSESNTATQLPLASTAITEAKRSLISNSHGDDPASTVSNKRPKMSSYVQQAAQQQLQHHLPLSPTSEIVPTGDGIQGEDGGQYPISSRVLLMRNLSQTVNELDIEQLVAPFSRGYRPKIYLQVSHGYGFVEFADDDTAAAALHYLKLHPINLKGTVVHVTFSRRDSVTTLEEKIEPFKVILASVTNIAYAVDIDLINFLFSKYGIVEKIVTFTKTPNMYQALIQYAEPEQAKGALVALHNRNIYDGCNSLQIQPSHLTELTVKVNNSKAWDFTVSGQQDFQQLPHQTVQQTQIPNSILPTPHGGHGSGGPVSQQHNVQHPGMGGMGGPGGPNMMGHGVPMQTTAAVRGGHYGTDLSKAAQQHLDMNSMPAMLQMQHHAQLQQMQQLPHPNVQMLGQGMGQQGMVMGGGMMHPHSHVMNSRSHHALLLEKLPKELKDISMDAANPNQTPVIIVYNLSASEITVTKLFNLFSLYGTVLRIKILREKQDTALIQFSDPLYATVAYNFLQGAPVFQEDSGIQICYSKNSEVKLPPPGSSDSETELKRTCAFGIRDQRYGPSEDVEKYLRGASRPTCTLFIANVHEDTTEDELRELFGQYGEIRAFKFRPAKEGSKKRMAFVELSSEKETISALCNLHNHRLREASIKIAFSKTTIGGTGPASA